MSVTLTDGIVVTGTLSHIDDWTSRKPTDSVTMMHTIHRSLYIEDYLYTVSQAFVMVNEIISLNSIAKVHL